MFGGQNAMTPQQRAQYLPVMKALLKVMETKYPAAQDINTLMILTRDLSKQVPKVGTDRMFGSAELFNRTFSSAKLFNQTFNLAELFNRTYTVWFSSNGRTFFYI